MSDPFIGEIRAVGFNFAPVGWALCAGQLLPISQNAALFALLGTTYGGNGTSNFQLPNLQGRVIVGMGQATSGQYYDMGEISGSESVTLSSSQLPMHTHAATFTGTTPAAVTPTVTVQGSAATGSTTSPAGNYMAGKVGTSGLYSASAAGGGNIAGVSASSITLPAPAGSVSVTAAGGNAPLSVMQPYLVVNYVIALIGIFPTRE